MTLKYNNLRYNKLTLWAALDSGRMKPEHIDWRRVAEEQRMQLDAAVKALRTIDSLCEKAHLLFRPTMDWQQINKVQAAITEIEEVAEIGGSQ